MNNEVTVPIGVYIFSAVSTGLSLVILGYVLIKQLQQFKVQSPLQGLKVLLASMILFLFLANLVTFTISIVKFNQPISGTLLSLTSVLSRFMTLFSVISLGLVYRFQARFGNDN